MRDNDTRMLEEAYEETVAGAKREPAFTRLKQYEVDPQEAGLKSEPYYKSKETQEVSIVSINNESAEAIATAIIKLAKDNPMYVDVADSPLSVYVTNQQGGSGGGAASAAATTAIMKALARFLKIPVP
jgi:hypothetical protein